MNRKGLSDYLNKLELISGCILAFLIPLWPSFLPYIIGLIILVNLTSGTLFNSFKKPHLKWLLLFTAFYLIYLLSITYSSNSKSGADELGRKLSLIVFPLVYVGGNLFTRIHFKTIIVSFLGGCLIAVILSFAHSFYMLINDPVRLGIDYFFKDRLSFIMHPTYFSIYLVFAIAILFLNNSHLGFNFVTVLASVLFFSIAIVFVNSKAAVISLFSLSVLCSAFGLLNRRDYILPLTSTVTSLTVFLILFFTAPQYSGRYSAAVKAVRLHENTSSNHESSAERVVIWKSAIEVAKRNFLKGVGVGAQTDSLDAQYKSDNASAALELQLNAHNNYLQALVTTGIFGLLALLSMLFIPAWFAFKNGDWLYLSFIFLIAFNMLFESMFQTQTGVVFYGFFNMVLFKNMKAKEERKS